jgi:hypothetical protein
VIVVTETNAINYLVPINEIELLVALYGEVALPPAVRRWMAAPPKWIQLAQAGPDAIDLVEPALDAGEREAIALALDVRAEVVLLNDRQAGRLSGTTRGCTSRPAIHGHARGSGCCSPKRSRVSGRCNHPVTQDEFLPFRSGAERPVSQAAGGRLDNRPQIRQSAPQSGLTNRCG